MSSRQYVINTGHLFIAFGVIAVLTAMPRINEIQAEQQARSESREPGKAEFERGMHEARQVKQGNKLAMARAKTGGVIEIVSVETGQPYYFSERIEGVARETQQSLAPGQLVGNRFGESAIVGEDGFLQNIAIASPADKERFVELLN